VVQSQWPGGYGALVDMGFSFIKMSDEDQKVLRTVISLFGEGEERKPKSG